MKRIFAAAALFAAVALLAVAGPLFSAAATREMEQQLSGIEASVEREDFAAARKQEEHFRRCWESRSRILSAFMNHTALGEADTSLAALEMHLRYENQTWAMIHCGDLKEILQKLRKTEEPLPENIL